MLKNTIKHDELYLRCIFCGDSQKNPNKAHLSVNLTSGLYHCFRCQARGVVSTQLLFELQLQVGDLAHLDYGTKEPLPTIIAGPGTERKSALKRYHTPDGDDVFYSWWNDQHVGYYVRGKNTKKLWGFAGVGYKDAPQEQISTPENPLYFVEGPYDVLNNRDVCFFGIPSLKKIQMLYAEHYFILRPDGDLWLDQSRFGILKALINALIKDGYGFLGVEFLEKGKDPDETSGKFIPVEYFKEKLWQSKSSSLRAQQALASLRL